MLSEFKDIPGSKNWYTLDLIDKGWSNDKKYYVITNDNRQFLLRISDVSTFERKKEEYEMMKMLDSCDILMSRPIDFGVCNNGKSVFILLSWIEGNDAETVLPTLTTREQYDLGYSMGKALRKIHQIPASSHQEDWAEYFNKKVDRKISSYEACGIKIDKANKIIDYINDNRSLLENRAQTIQHGDFHIGNMIITAQNEIGIIDFNRYDYGDPWEEFNRIVWCAKISEHFASGRINGYFEGNVPETFFKLMALYIGSDTLSSVPWAIPFGESEVKTMIDKANNVMDWYNDFTSYIPKWYIPIV
jgi:aminoglycoside phosphotransferase (APT) family kinase protein